jgi:hypothetical protein
MLKMKKRLNTMAEKANFYLFDDKVYLKKYSLYELILGGSVTMMILSGVVKNTPNNLKQTDLFLLTLGLFAILGGLNKLSKN